MSKLQEAIADIDELIALKEKQIALFHELRRNLSIALRAGVDPNDIDRFGYDQSKDQRWKKWPFAWRDEIYPEPNYVILKDGRRVDFEIDFQTRLDEARKKREEAEKRRLGLV